MRFNLVSVCQTETKMGTYTTNYNLFMPSIGEQGWGDLVNGNFTTIDTTMKSLSNNIVTLETEADAIEERVTTIENKIGTGAYVANAKLPIMAKFTTTDEGYGIVSVANSTDYTRPFGFEFVNMDATYSFTFSARNTTGGNNPSISVYVRNIFDNTTRLLETKTFWMQTTTTFNLTAYMYEVPYYNATVSAANPTWTKPAIYIGTPE